jgi:hypothetical protein
MIIPKFYLKDKSSNSETLISMKFKFDNKVFQYSTKRFIMPDLWDFDTQRPIPYKLIPAKYKSEKHNLKINLTNIKNEINLLSEIFVDEFNNLKRKNGFVNFIDLKEIIQKRTKAQDGKEEESTYESFEQYLKRFVTEIEQDKRIINVGKNCGQKYSATVLQGFKFWESGVWGTFIDKNKKYKKFTLGNYR